MTEYAKNIFFNLIFNLGKHFTYSEKIVNSMTEYEKKIFFNLGKQHFTHQKIYFIRKTFIILQLYLYSTTFYFI